MLGAQGNNGWTLRFSGQTQGYRYFKVCSSNNSLPIKFLGRGSSNERHTDVTIVIGKNAHKGYKGRAHGTAGESYLTYFYTDDGTNATLYVRTTGAYQARIFSIIQLNDFEEISELPGDAVEITLT